ncbi:methyltransferase domain-containing protein [Filomicrobium insigne]|uniref:methyltransferase domain-containing protein n=1 Tax=Filomicrobium insigne TaxID=418854 RepID=UPI00147B14FE|nr:methyltransferase domain-containing protein [Filomicrobium insigne]
MTDAFWYARRHGETVGAATTVLEAVSKCVRVQSAVDIGCGTGTWLAVAKQFGAAKVLGLDGPHVPVEHLDINYTEFQATDLTKPPENLGVFDLAICLEVAEHLPVSFSEELLDFLTSLSNTVVFSAAIPGQGGNGHVNERWQEFWVLRFQERGYHCYDFLRPLIWNRNDIPQWYCQNIFLFSRRDDLASIATKSGYFCLPASMRNVVHPKTFSHLVTRVDNPGIMRSVQLLRRAVLSRWKRSFASRTERAH